MSGENAVLLVDRFVSASTAEDVTKSLESILEMQRQDIQSMFRDEFPASLLQVLQGAYKNLPVEPSLAVRIYLQLVDEPTVLTEPAPGRLMEALVDLACDDESSTYPRVLALQCIEALCRKHTTRVRDQLLEAPNGLHRLGDLLSLADEQVRNQALLLATVLSDLPPVANAWVFGDVGLVVSELAIQEGQSSVVVLDCLLILKKMAQHTKNAALILESPILHNLTQLLDLRKGTNFVNPKSQVQEQADDLDDLLKGDTGTKEKEKVVPKLTEDEEEAIRAVFGILEIVLDEKDARTQVWKTKQQMVYFTWEMSVLNVRPNATHECAIPSVALQQRALQVTSLVFNDPALLDTYLNRLLEFVCSGGPGATFKEKIALSQSALHVIRQTLPVQTAHEMLLHSMAPLEEDAVSVVTRLLNTTAESYSDQSDAGKIKLWGALSALSLFITDEASRSMLLRLASSLMDGILDCLASQEDEFVVLVCLRFVVHWIQGAPVVVQAMLSSAQSAYLSTLIFSKDEKRAAIAALIFGLALDMGDDESKCGGWTRTSVMDLITKSGLSRFYSRLEALKKPANDLPWSACSLEWKVWLQWSGASTLGVRKQVVQQLTSGHGDDNDTSEASANENSLEKLVAQQTVEIDQLRMSMVEAHDTISVQGMSGKAGIVCILPFWLTSLSLQRKNYQLGSIGSKAIRLNWMKC
jgi:hypothetical protein